MSNREPRPRSLPNAQEQLEHPGRKFSWQCEYILAFLVPAASLTATLDDGPGRLQSLRSIRENYRLSWFASKPGELYK